MVDVEAVYVARRPLVGIALSSAFGMAAASFGLLSFPVLWFAGVLSVVAAVVLRRTSAGTVLFWSSIVLVAAARFMLAAATVASAVPAGLRDQLPLTNVRLIGRTMGAGVYYPSTRGDTGVWSVPVKCDGVLANGLWLKLRAPVQVRILNAPGDPLGAPGQRVECTGTLSARTYPGAEPLEFRVGHPEKWQVCGPEPRWLPGALGERIRQAAAQRLGRGLAPFPEQLGVMKALLLGNRERVPRAVRDQFARTGTMHIFAISGLHVGMLGLLLVIVIRTLGVPRDKWGLVLIPLLLIYVVSTGMKSSALRAVVMAGVYFLAPLFRRRPDLPLSVAVAGLLMLFTRPLQIQSVGFIYSFTVVIFIVLVFSAQPVRSRLVNSGRMAAIRHYISSLGITSFAAFLGAAPLTALFFGTFSPVALIGNLIVVPLTFCVVLSGWLAILDPFAGGTFGHAGLLFVNLLLRSNDLLAAVPGACWNVPPPPAASLLLWYAGWIGFFAHPRWRRSARIRCWIMIIVSLPLLFLGVFR